MKTILLITGMLISLNTYAYDLDSLVNKILNESNNVECSYYDDFAYLKIKHNVGYIRVNFKWFIQYDRKEEFWSTITYKNGDLQPIGYSNGGRYLNPETYDRIHTIFKKYNPNHIYNKSIYNW